MNTEYESLNLDGLLELSRSDAEHAGDMAEQARVLREMSGSLTDNVDLMRGVMETLFADDAAEAPWSGESAKMMKTELDRLFTPASSAPQVFEDNAKAMDDFGTKVHSTLVEIDRLHVQSKGHGGDAGGEEADIKKARQIMQTATTGYLTSAESMPEPEFYNGLRKSADDDPSGGWTEAHGAVPAGAPSAPVAPASYADPGSQPTEPAGYQPWTSPSDTEPVDPTEPELQGPSPSPSAPPAAPPAAPPTNPVNPVNPVQPPPIGPIGGRPPASPPGFRPPVSPGPRPAPITLRPAPNPLVPRTGPTVPSVIGPRRPPAMPPMQPRPVVPNPNGTVPPVIGPRGGPAQPMPFTRPIPPGPNGTVRPVIGPRGGPVGPLPTRPVVPNPEGTVRPVIGTRPGPGVVPFGARPAPLGPNGTVPPGTAPRTGTGMVPPTGRPVPPNGAVPLTGARSGFGVPGSAGRGKPQSKPVPRSGVVGDSELVPGRHANARPAGGLAFGSAPRPQAATSTTAAGLPASRTGARKPGEARAAATKPPGQRVPRMPRQGGAAVEQAINRGAQRKPVSRAPGQEVFAKFDAAAKAAKEQENKPKREIDPDSDWAIRTVSVPAVITTRKAE